MTKVKIHQIFYKESQRLCLDSGFLPYKNAENFFEYGVFRKALLRDFPGGLEYQGFLSWKFGYKSGLTSTDFKAFMEKNPGFDVYYVNPFPQQAFYSNVWEQGEVFHPGITSLAEDLASRSGQKIDLRSIRNSVKTTTFSNYFVGNRYFWDRFFEFCEPVMEVSLKEEGAVFSVQADDHIRAPMFPFIFERWFSTLLATDSSISYCPYLYGEAQLSQKMPDDRLVGLYLKLWNESDEGQERELKAQALEILGTEKWSEPKWKHWLRNGPLAPVALKVATSLRKH